MSVSTSVRPEKFGSYLTDSYEILYMRIYQ